MWPSGENFRFGVEGAAAAAPICRPSATAMGCGVHVVAHAWMARKAGQQQAASGAPCAGTNQRSHRLLERPYRFSGPVCARRGPGAGLLAHRQPPGGRSQKFLPAEGVYAPGARLVGRRLVGRDGSVMNLGRQPTVDRWPLRPLEVHLLDSGADLEARSGGGAVALLRQQQHVSTISRSSDAPDQCRRPASRQLLRLEPAGLISAGW